MPSNKDLLASLGGDDDLMSIMDAREESNPWIAEKPGDSVIGTVVSIDSVSSDYQPGLQIPRITLETDDGKYVSVTAYHTTLRTAIEEANPQVGYRFAAKFFGEGQNKKGQSFKKYRAVSAPPASGNGNGPAAEAKADEADAPF